MQIVLKKTKKIVRNNNIILKTQQRFNSKRHNSYTKGITKIAITSNDDKRMQSIGSTEKYAHEMSKDLIWKKTKIKGISITKQYKSF